MKNLTLFLFFSSLPLNAADAVFLGAATDQSEIRVRDIGKPEDTPTNRLPALGAKLIKVKDASLKTAVKTLRPGDGVTYTANSDQLTDIAISRPADQPAALCRAFVMAASAAVLFAIAFLFCWGWPMRDLTLGIDGRYSNSKTQILLWFGAFLVAYLSTLYFRYTVSGVIGYIDIPQNLLLITGLSSFTFVGAKAITEKKVAAAPTSKPAADTPSFPEDLARDDNKKFDMADFQMILVTLIATVTFLVQVHAFLGQLDFRVAVSLPDVDSTILAALGLGQGAYLAKKATSGIAS